MTDTYNAVLEEEERARRERSSGSGAISEDAHRALADLAARRDAIAELPSASFTPPPSWVPNNLQERERFDAEMNLWRYRQSQALRARLNLSTTPQISADEIARRQRNSELYGTTALSTDLERNSREASIISSSPQLTDFYANETNAILARDDVRPLSFWQIVGDLFRMSNTTGNFSPVSMLGQAMNLFGGNDNRVAQNIHRHVGRGVYQSYIAGLAERENPESALDTEVSNSEGAPLTRRIGNFVYSNSRLSDEYTPLTADEQYELNAYRHDEMMGLISRADMADNFGGWFLENIVPTVQGLAEVPGGIGRGANIAWERAVRNWDMGDGGTPADAIERTWAVLSLGPDVVASGTLGAITGPIAYTYQQEAGNAYLEYTQMMDDNGEFMDRRIAGAYARDVGAINSIFEVVNIGAIGGFLGAGKLTGFLANAGVRSAFRRYALNDGLRRMAGGVIGTAFSEGVTEAAQEVSVVALGEMARLADSGVLDMLSPKEVAQRLFDVVTSNIGRIAEAGVAGAVIGGGIGSVIAPVTIGSLIEDARLGEYQQAIWRSIETQSENSKLRERAPGVYNRLISKLVQNTPLEQVAINVEDFIGAFNQDVDLARAAAREMTGVGAEAFDEAQKTGGDMFIPAAAMSQIAGTAQYGHIAKHVKLGPEIASLAEVEARLELGIDVERAIEAGSKFQEEMLSLEEAKQRVRQEFFDRLQGSETWSQDEFSGALADLFSEGYFTIAKAAGIDPKDMPKIPTIVGPYGKQKLTQEQIDAGGFATQEEDISKAARGATAFERSVDSFMTGAKIIFTETRNASTAPHEIFGHYFLELLRFAAAQQSATPILKNDWQTTLDWLGMTDERWEAALKLDPKSAAAVLAPAHEKFARAVEVYFTEGRAPTPRLKRVFRMFKVWMLRAFRETRRMAGDAITHPLYKDLLDDRIRPVLDRMFASKEAIAEYAAMMGSDEIMTREEWGGVGNKFADAAYERYRTRIVDARRRAEEAVDAAAIAVIVKENMLERRRAEARARRTVEAEMQQDPKWIAHDVITGRMELPQTPGVRLNSALVFEEYGKGTYDEMPRGAFDVDTEGLIEMAMEARGVKEPTRFALRVQQLGIYDSTGQIEAIQGNKKGLRKSDEGRPVSEAIQILWDEGWFGSRNNAEEYFQGGGRGSISMMARDGTQVEIVVDPTNVKLMRMTTPPLWDRQNAWKYDTLRWVKDDQGKTYVAPARVLHDDIVNALSENGITVSGYLEETAPNEGHGTAQTGWIRREGDRLIFSGSFGDTYLQADDDGGRTQSGLGANRLLRGDVAKPRRIVALDDISDPSVVAWREYLHQTKSGPKPAVAIRIVELSFSTADDGAFLNPTEIAAQMQREGFFKGKSVREAADLVDQRRALLRGGYGPDKKPNKVPAIVFPALKPREQITTRRQARFWAERAALDQEAYTLFNQNDDETAARRGGAKSGPRAVGAGWTLARIAEKQNRSLSEISRGIKRHEARLGDIAAEAEAAAKAAVLSEFDVPAFRNYDARDLVLMFNDGLDNARIAAELSVSSNEDIQAGTISVQLTRIRNGVRGAITADAIDRLALAMDISADELSAFVSNTQKRRVPSLRAEARRLVASGVTAHKDIVVGLKEYAALNNLEYIDESLVSTASVARGKAGIASPQWRRLDPEIKDEIVALRKDGLNATEIADRLSVPVYTVRQTIARRRATGEAFPKLNRRASETYFQEDIPFDTEQTFYHGTSANVRDELRASTDGLMGPGVYIAVSERSAEEYAKGDGAQIIPVYRRQGRMAHVGRMAGARSAKDRAAIVAELRAAGFVGIADPENGFANIFDANDVASIFDRRVSETYFQRDIAPIWHSGLELAIERLAFARADTKQWIGTIKNAGGTSAEELEFSGVIDWLEAQSGQVSKESVLAFVRENGVRVEETVLGEVAALTPEEQADNLKATEEYDRLARLSTTDIADESTLRAATDDAGVLSAFAEYAQSRERFWALSDSGERARADRGEIKGAADALQKAVGQRLMALREVTERYRAKGTAKAARWSQYTLPGGENYRELLLRLPTEQASLEQWRVLRADGVSDGLYASEDAARRRAIDIGGDVQEATPQPVNRGFRSSHFDQPNILAHVRFNERVDAQGRRTLFIEEVQSDWHQAGRERGYQTAPHYQVMSAKGTIVLAQGGRGRAVYADRAEAEAYAAHNDGWYVKEVEAPGVPDAPFKNNAWASLALKRMIRWAAENGFEQIAWTPGRVQIERFNLAEQVPQIRVRRGEADGEYHVRIHEPQRVMVQIRDQVGARVESKNVDEGAYLVMTLEQMEQVFGKDLTKTLTHRAAGSASGPFATVATNNLEVGGSGMRAFYDRILPNIANDLGKKYGARVGETAIPLPSNATETSAYKPSDYRVEERDGGWIVTQDRSRAPGTPVFATKAEAEARRSKIVAQFDAVPETVHAFPITPEMREVALYLGLATFGKQITSKRTTETYYQPYDGDVTQFAFEEHDTLDRETGDSRMRVSTRHPWTASPAEDAIGSRLVVGFDSVLADEKFAAKVAAHVRGLSIMRPVGGETDVQTIERYINIVADNLLWLHDSYDAETRDRADEWYNGARAITEAWMMRYGVHDYVVAGVIAALSPQKDWFQNVSQAERVLDIYSLSRSFAWTDEMQATADRILPRVKLGNDGQPEMNAKGETKGYVALRDILDGRTIEQIEALELATNETNVLIAAWVRIYDQTYNDPSFRVIMPEGWFGDFVTNKDGSNTRSTWGSLNEIGKAISIIRDPLYENVVASLGAQHKVRNFYNNILAPNAPHGDVTIDTHAVAAALLRPLSANSKEVGVNLNGPPGSAATGSIGTYGINAEAYRRAAIARGLLPRQMQSIAWEAIRTLFKDTWKTAKNNDLINGIWQEYRDGKATIEETREKIATAAGGIKPPSWVGARPSEGVAASFGYSTYEGELPRARLSRWTAGLDARTGRPAADRVARIAGGERFYQLEEGFDERRVDMAERIAGDVGLTQQQTIDIYKGLLADHNEKMLRAMRLSLGLQMTSVGKRADVVAEAQLKAIASQEMISDLLSKMISRYGEDVVMAAGVPISWDMRDQIITTEELNAALRERKGEASYLRSVKKSFNRAEETLADIEAEAEIIKAEIERRTRERAVGAFEPTGGMAAVARATDEEVLDWFYHSGEVRVSRQRDSGDPVVFFKTSPELRAFNCRLTFDAHSDGGFAATTHYRGRFNNRDWAGKKQKPTAVQRRLAMAFFARMALVARAFVLINKPSYLEFEGGSESHEKLYLSMMRMFDFSGYTARRERTLHGYVQLTGAASGRSTVSEGLSFILLRPDIAAQTPPREIPPTAVSENQYGSLVVDFVQPGEGSRRRAGTLIWFSEETTDVKNSTGQAATRDPKASRFLSGGNPGNVRAVSIGIGSDDIISINSIPAKERALRTLDEAEGWFYQEEEAPTEGEFLDALRDDVSGVSPRYRAQDMDAALNWLEAKRVREFFARRGVDISAKPAELEKQIALIAEQLDDRGIDADTMASIVNAHLGYKAFASGKEMLDAVVNLPTRSEHIKKRVEQLVNGELGDPMDDLPSAASLSMHNIDEEQRILMELQATQEAAGTGAGRAINRTAKDYAERRVERMSVRQIQNPEWALATERRWAKAAIEASRKGNAEAANKAKFNQLINFHIYKMARSAKVEMERAQLYFKKLQKLNARARITPDYYEQIEALLDQYEVRNISVREVARRISLADWVRSMEDKGLGHMVQIDPDVIARSDRIPFQQLTVEQARALRDAIKNLDHLGSLKDKLLTAAEQRTFEGVLTDLIGAMAATGPVDPNVSRNYSESDTQRVSGKLRRWNAALTRMEFLFRYIDGTHNGVLWRTLFLPFASAADKKSAYQHRVALQLTNLWDKYSPSERAMMFKTRITIPELMIDSDVTGQNDTFTRMELIAIALNLGNTGNVAALVDGFQWFASPQGVETDYVSARAKIVAALDRHMTKRDWEFVQETWNIIAQFRDEAFDLHQRLTGLRPEAVEATPLQSKHGVFAGGYYPLKFDPLRDAVVERREAKENTPVNNWGVSSLAPMTKKGHLIDRKGSGGRPVRLDFAVATDHIENVIHDISYREALIDVNRIVSDARFRAAFIRTVGKEQYAQLHPWLHSIAVEYRDPTSDVGKLLQRMRGNMQIVTMGAKIATATQQIAGLLQAVPMLGSAEMAMGVVRMLNNPFQLREKSEYIMGKSEFMRTRVRTFNRDVREFLRRVKDDTIVHKTQRNAFALVGAMDWAVSSVVWITAYEKARAGKVKGIEPGIEEDAVRFADSMVRQTQSAGLNQDLPLVMRNTEMEKLVTAFYSYFSVLYNWTTYDQVLGARKNRVPLYIAAGNFFLIYIMAPLLTEWLAGRWDKDGEDDEERLQRMLAVIARAPFSSVPILRDAANAIGSFYDYSLTPFEGGFQSVIDMTEDVASGEILGNESAQKNAAFAVGFIFGLPTAQFYITADYLRDYAEGEEEGLDLTEALLRDTR